jgi:hypothetical protein
MQIVEMLDFNLFLIQSFQFSKKIIYFKVKIGLIINLTDTNRYYDPISELRLKNIEYKKINCTGYVFNTSDHVHFNELR